MSASPLDVRTNLGGHTVGRLATQFNLESARSSTQDNTAIHRSVDDPPAYFTAENEARGRIEYDLWIRWVLNQCMLRQVGYVLDDKTLFGPSRMPDADEDRPLEPAPIPTPENAEPLPYLKLNLDKREAWIRDAKAYDSRIDKCTADIQTAIAIYDKGIRPGSPAQYLFDQFTTESNIYKRLRTIQETFHSKYGYRASNTSVVDTLAELSTYTDAYPSCAQSRIFHWRRIINRAKSAGDNIGSAELLAYFIRGTTIPALISHVIVPHEQEVRANSNRVYTWETLAEAMISLIEDHKEFNENRPTPPTPAPSAVGAKVAGIVPSKPKQPASSNSSEPPGPCPYCNDAVNLHWARECTADACKLCHAKFTSPSARSNHRRSCPAKQQKTSSAPPSKRKSDGSAQHNKKRVKANQATVADPALLQRIAELEKQVAAAQSGATT